jgi:serine/threonine protein phosphatase PrpC
MNYATTYDVGDRKRGAGINEDSVAVTVFEDGHREGYHGRTDSLGGTEVPATRSVCAFVLADGAGGHDAGDAASYIATTAISEALAPVAVRIARGDTDAFRVDVPGEEHDGETVRTAIEEAIQTAHREVVAHAEETGAGAYTTVVAGIAVDGRLHYGWVGDSRLYVLNRAHDHAARVTEDHAVVEQLHAEGEVDAVAAHVHPRGNEITRALGGPGDPETATVAVETGSVPLYAEDVVLATSDGLPDAQTDAPLLYDRYVESDRSAEVAATVRERVVTDEDIRRWVLTADSLSAAAGRLVAEANARGGKDNLSVVAFEDDTYPETPARLPLRARDPHPVQRRETVVEE